MNWFKKAQSLSVRLTPEEESIFALIRASRDAYAKGVSLRVAGGWVRDRVMGKLSDDIDIAVSGGDGIRIADAVGAYDRANGLGRTGKPYSVSLEKGGESSGLRVGAVDIDGVKVEFVPMRTESYRGDSRVPSMVPSDSHVEDAKRRDLTINAMYYNIDSGEIEDPTGGMRDLKMKILRTPDEPVKTLVEDPLRALRALRFLSKMDGFKLDDGLRAAIEHASVHSAYGEKVAPERARKELEGMAKGSDPASAIDALLRSGLYKKVFAEPRLDDFKPITMGQNNPHHDLNLIDHTVAVVRNMNELMKQEGYSERDRMLAVLASMFHDFGKMDPSCEKPSRSTPGASSYPGHEDISADIAESVLKRLGFGAERSTVAKIVQEHMRAHGQMETPKAMGKYLRDLGDLWHVVMLHGKADAMGKGGGGDQEELRAKDGRIGQMREFMSQRGERASKPLLGGRDLMQLFPDRDPKTGFIKDMTATLLEAQDTGEVHDKNSAIEYLKRRFGGGGS